MAPVSDSSNRDRSGEKDREKDKSSRRRDREDREKRRHSRSSDGRRKDRDDHERRRHHKSSRHRDRQKDRDHDQDPDRKSAAKKSDRRDDVSAEACPDGEIPKSEGAPNIRAVLKDAMIATAIEMEIGIARKIEMRAKSHQNIVPRNARGKDEKVTNPNVIRKNCLRTSCTTLERKHYFPQRFYSIHPMTTSHTTIIFASICTAAKGLFLKI